MKRFTRITELSGIFREDDESICPESKPWTEVCLWGFLTLICGIAGPFGTYGDFGLLFRLLIWGDVIAIAMILLSLAKNLTRKAWPRLHETPEIMTTHLLFVGLFAIALWTSQAVLLWLVDRPLPGGELILIAVLVSIFIHLVMADYLNGSNGAAQVSTSDETPRVLLRVPENLRGTILRISANDHQVEICTSRGAHRLRMRFKDATDEALADGLDGFCVHRSHWVMRDAISKVTRQSGRVFLELNDGSSVPVSRKYRMNVENAGLLDPVTRPGYAEAEPGAAET